MSTIVKPSVYFVGYTQIDLEQIKRYLLDGGQDEFLNDIKEAQERGLSGGEILCSFYAKLCYASLVVGKNNNISKTRSIYDNIIGTIESGHGCYDADTEVYTQRGWVFWPDVTTGDIFATLNQESGQLEWHTPNGLISKYYSGDMIRYDSNMIDLLVTPNHNMLACLTSTKQGRKGGFSDFRLQNAASLLGKSHFLLKSLPTCYTGDKFDPLYQLLGFAIGDGYISATSNMLNFHIRRPRKVKYLSDLCRQMDITLIHNRDQYRIRLDDMAQKQDKPWLIDLFKNIYQHDRQKRIPENILHNCHKQKALASLLDGLMNSDGCKGGVSECYDTTSSYLSGQFQFLLNVLGVAGNISQASCYQRSHRNDKWSDIYRVSIFKRSGRVTFNKSAGAQYEKSWTVPEWSGMVYCADVPNHTLYVRRNGKALWCGNSVLEHCNLNFLITNCSRILTHELVRHRVGTAMSQTSGRYVRTDEIKFVHDPILDGCSDIINETLRYLENAYHKMEERIDINNIKDFSVKKKLTSAMRRILPNGQANEIGFSFNIRALRHTITMRTSRHAEWEIRYVFNQIYNLVYEKYPAIFADSKVEMVDELPEITFVNRV